MRQDATARGLRRFLCALLLVYIAKQLVVAFVSPPFTGHDEVAHFAGVRIVATEHRIPTLVTATMPPDLYAYRAYAIEWRDPYRSPLYTAVHPPLYYVLMAPIYRAVASWPAERIQYVLRCASIPFGAITVVMAFLMTRALFPGDAFLGVTVPTLAAFQTQVSYEAAMVNNDALATALYSVMLYTLVMTVRDGPSRRRGLMLGAVAAVSLLAKGNAIAALILIPLALVAGARRVRPVSAWLPSLGAAYAVVLLVVGPWWWFMTRMYHDPFGFDALAATQPDLTRTDASLLQLLFSGRFLVDRWNESWGEFGWRLIHVSPTLVASLAVVALACFAGLVWTVLRTPNEVLRDRWRVHAVAILAAACVLAYAGAAQFGVRFVLTQARYIFPTVDAAAVLAMIGLRAWIPFQWRTVAQGLVVFAALAVNVTIYTAYVVPYWYFR